METVNISAGGIKGIGKLIGGVVRPSEDFLSEFKDVSGIPLAISVMRGIPIVVEGHADRIILGD